MAHNGGFHITRVGMGIVFFWIGLLIFKSPESWGGYMQPWAVGIVTQFTTVRMAMLETAVLDIIIGAMLIVGWHVWIAAFLAAGHMAVVLITSGINDVTVRDIAILTAALALFYDDLPLKIRMWVQKTFHITPS